MALMKETKTGYKDAGYISMAEIEWRKKNSEELSEEKFNKFEKENYIIDKYYYTSNQERYIIREKECEVIPAALLAVMKYGKDYTMEDGFIILTNGERYTMPRADNGSEMRFRGEECSKMLEEEKQKALDTIRIISKDGETFEMEDFMKAFGNRHDKPCPTSKYVWDYLI